MNYVTEFCALNKALNKTHLNLFNITVTMGGGVSQCENQAMEVFKSHSSKEQVPFIGDYVRIVCAICNKFFPPLSSSVDKEADESEAAKMLHYHEK